MKLQLENKSVEQRTEEMSSNNKYLSKIANASSLFCSVTGTSILAAILFGWANMLDHKRIQIATDYAYTFLIAALLLWLAGILLSISKKGLKPIDHITAQRDETHEKLPEENRNLNSNLKVYSDNIVSHTPDSKIALTNSKGKSKRLATEETCTKNVAEHIKANSNASINTLQHVELSKESKISAKSPKPNTTSSYYENNQLSDAEKQLVPIKKHQNPPLLQEARISPQAINLWNFISADKLGNHSVTELVATRRVRLFSMGDVQRQDEFQVKQTTIFRCSETCTPSYKVSELKFDQCDDHVFRRRFTPSQISKVPHINGVSDVVAKLESLNFMR